MDPVTRVLDECLSQVEEGLPVADAAAVIADNALREDVAGLLAIATELSVTAFASPPASFRTELARQLAELDLTDPLPVESPGPLRRALPLVVGVGALLAVLGGLGGWATLLGAAPPPRVPAPLAPRARASATLVARRAAAGVSVVMAPVNPTAAPSPVSMPAGRSGAATTRAAARTAWPPPTPTTGPSPLAEAPTVTQVPGDPGRVPDTPVPSNPPPGSPEPTVELAGRVLWGDEPAPGVRVVAVRSEPGAGCADTPSREIAQTSSSVDGRFSFSGPASGDYRVFAEGGPACLPRRWHVAQLALGAADPCAATTYELRGQADVLQFVDVRYALADGGVCPSPSP